MQIDSIEKKTITLSLLLTVSSFIFAVDDVHLKAREYFIKAGSESCQARELIPITETNDTEQDVVMAYNGAAYTLIADCVKLPTQKLKNFNTGKEILDKALSRDPLNPEIRYIRIMVQNGVPKFLNYNNLQEDMQAFINLLLKKAGQKGLDEFDKKMAEIILFTEVPDKMQREKLNTIL